MRPFLAVLAVFLVVSPGKRAAAQAPAPRAPMGAPALPSTSGGSVRSDRVTVEVLPPRAGSEIRTPEGFIRMEGSPAPSGVASFGTYRAGQPASYQVVASAAAATPGENGGVSPAPPEPRRDPCRAERSSYLRRLLYMSGIDLDDPLAFLEGVAGPNGYPAQYLFTTIGLLPGTDPIRALAWDQELRSLARELTSCSQASAR